MKEGFMAPMPMTSSTSELTTMPHVSQLPYKAGRVALVLNHRARAVTGVLAQRLTQWVGAHHVYASHTMAQAASLSETLVKRGYDTVACAGGDGTFVSAVNHILRHSSALPARHQRALPAFAFLALGTGNALRRTAGGTDPVADLARLVRGDALTTLTLPLIQGPNNERFLFGGMGYDSTLLSDYTWLCDHATRGPARPVVRSLAGYIAALCTRTLPRLAKNPSALVVRVTLKADGHYIDPGRGDMVMPVAAGTRLYEGSLGMLGVGTTPFYGYGLKIFPFAGMLPGFMQLRLVTMNPAQALRHLPALWNGSYRNANLVRDYAVSDVQIDLEQPHPFQHSGEDRGMVDSLRLTMSPERLKLVNFAQPS
jgi:diacylglycerol kinase family enzyme